MRRLGTTALVSAGALSVASVALSAAPPIVIQPIDSSPAQAAPVTANSPGASVTLSSTKPGARSVRLAIKLPAVLQCGYPRGGAVVVTLPQKARVPNAILRAAVKVNGRSAGNVTVSHRAVTVSMPRPAGMLCDSITDGTLLVAFGSGAKLGNPPRAGTYSIKIRRGPASYAAPIKIR